MWVSLRACRRIYYMTMEKRFRIGITQALPAAIGYEMILNAFSNSEILEFFTPVIYGSERALQATRKATGVNVPYKVVAKAENAHDGHVNLINLPHPDASESTLSVDDSMALASLSAACADVNEGRLDALVVFPAAIAENPQDEHARISVADYLVKTLRHEADVLPVLCAPMLRVALPTMDAGEKSASLDVLEQKLRQACEIVCRDFLASAPRVALLADVVVPNDTETPDPAEMQLVDRLVSDDNLRVFGPYNHARYFSDVQYKHFECAVAAEGGVGQRLFAETTDGEGVTFYSGFDVPVCSPLMPKDACDEIAIRAFLQSLYHVLDVSRNREMYDESHANPLPHVVQHDRREERRNRAEAK